MRVNRRSSTFYCAGLCIRRNRRTTIGDRGCRIAAPAVEEPTIPDEASPPDPALSEIVSFDPLSGAISNQSSLVVHGRIGDLVFLTTLQAKNGNGETITINNVTWTPNKPFSKLRADVFYYTPTIPSEYTVQRDSLPKITINVNRRVTYVTGNFLQQDGNRDHNGHHYHLPLRRKGGLYLQY